jgi:hypothetical protein
MGSISTEIMKIKESRRKNDMYLKYFKWMLKTDVLLLVSIVFI